jgi:hypothetical protein
MRRTAGGGPDTRRGGPGQETASNASQINTRKDGEAAENAQAVFAPRILDNAAIDTVNYLHRRHFLRRSVAVVIAAELFGAGR